MTDSDGSGDTSRNAELARSLLPRRLGRSRKTSDSINSQPGYRATFLEGEASEDSAAESDTSSSTAHEHDSGWGKSDHYSSGSDDTDDSSAAESEDDKDNPSGTGE